MSDTNIVKNWSYPFKTAGGSSKEVTDPQVYFDALAKAENGFYPMGKNGLWHGGVHFDNNTAALLDQSSIRCIADGEVIAYRIDQIYPETQYGSAYTPGAGPEAVTAKYSTGFVLVKHLLELPPAPPSPAPSTSGATIPSTGAAPAETGAETTPAPTSSEPTAAPERLTFYSLYMHLLDLTNYEATPTLQRPAFWDPGLSKVKSDAPDKVRGLNVREFYKVDESNEHYAQYQNKLATLPRGTRIETGEAAPNPNHNWRRLIRAIPAVEGLAENTGWVYVLEAKELAESQYLVSEDKSKDVPATEQIGLHVRESASSSSNVLAVLPRGTEIQVSGEGNFVKLEAIVSGNAIPALTADAEGKLPGYVWLQSLEAQRSPNDLAKDKVYLLPAAQQIKAGELIGHPGVYQNHDDATACPLVHLEVFCCEDLPSFIGKSRAAAACLPAEQKTLLKVHKGASKLITHRAEISASNPPKVSDAGVMVGVDLILSQGQLDNLPAERRISVSETVPDSSTPKTTHWWRLDGLFTDISGNPIGGWLCEQPEITTRHSPWEWEGFDFISETACNADHLACHLDATAALEAAERTDYIARIDLADNGPLKSRLYDIIDGADGTARDNKITTQEIRIVLNKPWHAQSIARLATYYESEWFWKAEKWDELDVLMAPEGTPNADWLEEKKRIEKLCWFKELIDVLASDGKIWHIHFQALLSNMLSKPAAALKEGKITFDAEGNDIPGSIYFSRSIHWPGNDLSGVTLGRGYDMGSRSEPEIYNHMISAGVPPSRQV